MGCFGGGSEWITGDDGNKRFYNTREEAEDAAYDFIDGCIPWYFELDEEQDDDCDANLQPKGQEMAP